MTDRRHHFAAVGLALLVTFLWSTSWVLIRWGLDDETLEPVTFAALRYGMAAVALVVWVFARPTARAALGRVDRPLLRQIAVLGVVLYALTQGAQFVAIDSQPAATSSLVLSATPLLVAMLSARSLAEPPLPGQVAGGVLVVVGAATFFQGSLSATRLGMSAAIVGLIANAVAAILGRRANRPADVPAVVITALSMAVGATVLAVVGIAAEGWPAVSARAWAIIAWLAVVNTAMAFTWWNMSLRRLSAVASAGINNTMLLQIALLAWWLLDESPGIGGLVGILIVSAGVLLTQLRRA